MSKEAQVEQLTDYMAKFIAHVAKIGRAHV